MELQHFSHPHPLRLYPQLQNGGEKVSCSACLDPILGASYRCPQFYCKFFLHDTCAELPVMIRHYMHPAHPLSLLPKKPSTHSAYYCSYCGKDAIGFVYHCSSCDFGFDINCATRLQPFEHKGHQHSFLQHRPATFHCDACGKLSRKADEDSSYICITCQFWVHKNCASLPSSIKVEEHQQHPLILTYSLKFQKSTEVWCKICDEKVDTRFVAYSCETCTYVTHVECSTSVGDVSSTSRGFKKMSLKKRSKRKGQKYRHHHSSRSDDDESEEAESEEDEYEEDEYEEEDSDSAEEDSNSDSDGPYKGSTKREKLKNKNRHA